MAFRLGDLVIDRIITAVAENSNGELLYTLTNLQDASINITADSEDAVDGTGAVIKTFYRAKTGEFTATNSTLSLPILGAQSGTDPVYAGAGADALTIPRIVTTANKTTNALVGITTIGGTTVADQKIRVYGINANGTLGDKYATTEFTCTSAGQNDTWANIAIDNTNHATDNKWIIVYERSVTQNGIKIVNRSDAFPKSCKLTLKVLIVDPCETDVVRAAYVVLPNFQPSPEVEVAFSTDSTLDFTGKLQTSYCGTDKVLYEIYVASDDEEETA